MTLFDEPARTFDADPLGDGRARRVTPATPVANSISGDLSQVSGSQDVPAGRDTMAGRVAAFFKARPGEWIDGRELMAVAGSYGWRTRCSDIRRPPHSMTIDNRQRRVGRFVVSEYRYVPAAGSPLGGAE